MKKDIGAVMGLYPTPVTVCGTEIDGRVNWLTIAHVGVVEHNTLLISVDKNHELSNRGIQTNGTVSVNLVDEKMLKAADYCGIAKGAKVDKSNVFKYHFDDVKGAPIIEEAPLSMTCKVINKIEVGNFDNYILRPVHTYVKEEYLNERNKIDYDKMNLVLFEFQNAQYLSVGKVIGKCWSEGRNYIK